MWGLGPGRISSTALGLSGGAGSKVAKLQVKLQKSCWSTLLSWLERAFQHSRADAIRYSSFLEPLNVSPHLLGCNV